MVSASSSPSRDEAARSSPPERNGILAGLRLYLDRQASSFHRYVLEQTICLLLGGIPTVVGIGLRAVLYRLILRMDGWPAIENRVRLRFTKNIRLGHGAYLDEGVYLHACPNGIEIGERTLVMHGSVLHVYNFRNIPHSGIRIGRDSLVGEYNVLRGQGGIIIGDRVYTSPMVQMLAVNHVFEDTECSFLSQGITAKGIVVEDDVWIGAGAILTDGVRVGRAAVVAAGAVVVGDVPPRTLVAGTPARVIREIGKGDSRSPGQPVYF